MLSREAFEACLLRIGEERYHHRHPFNVRMHEGRLAPQEIRTWVRNRYYYQTRIPIKDGHILSKAEDPGFRRNWIERIHDHDGSRDETGGLELWLRLAEAVGLEREEVAGLRRVLPGVRVACDDYVRFVEGHDLLTSVAASLTEVFAGDLMRQRIEAFEKHYPWVDTEGLHYFRTRTVKAPRDGCFGLAYVLDRAQSVDDQQRCQEALTRKCEILWRLLDAVENAHGRPRLAPHALLRPDGEAGRSLVVLPERAVRVNDSGREILDLCDGERSIDEVAAELFRRHPEVEELEQDVHEFVEQMERLGVLEPTR
ncbi:MAG: pyrroloquinoline-quinone synthase PqqC [Myxococcota bacterium]